MPCLTLDDLNKLALLQMTSKCFTFHLFLPYTWRSHLVLPVLPSPVSYPQTICCYILSLEEPIVSDHLSPASVGKFLNTNPTFLCQWIRTNVSTRVLDSWLKERTVPSPPSAQQQQQQQQPLSDPALHLRTKDNHVDYITEGLFTEFVVGRRQSVAPSRQYLETRRLELVSMKEKDLFMELVRDISHELDVNLLCYKILWSVCILTKSDRASLFLVRGTKNDKYLVSKLFDVSETSTLYQSLHTEENMIVVPFGKGVIGTVALKKETINIRDAYKVGCWQSPLLVRSRPDQMLVWSIRGQKFKC